MESVNNQTNINSNAKPTMTQPFLPLPLPLQPPQTLPPLQPQIQPLQIPINAHATHLNNAESNNSINITATNTNTSNNTNSNSNPLPILPHIPAIPAQFSNPKTNGNGNGNVNTVSNTNANTNTNTNAISFPPIPTQPMNALHSPLQPIPTLQRPEDINGNNHAKTNNSPQNSNTNNAHMSTHGNGNGNSVLNMSHINNMNNQSLFQSLYNPNNITANNNNTQTQTQTPTQTQRFTNATPPSANTNTNGNGNKTATYARSQSDSKVNVRRGRPKKSSGSHRKAFEAGHPRFERALQQLIEMRQKHTQGLLPSIRGFMQTIHMGFANTNAVVKYYANNYLNMTLDDFKRDYMVIRRVRAKTRNNSGGRPKKSVSNAIKRNKADMSATESDSDDYQRNRNRNSHNSFRTRRKAPLQPLKMQNGNSANLTQQLLLNQFANSSNGMDFNFPLFFEGITNGTQFADTNAQMPKLIADVKGNMSAMGMGNNHFKIEDIHPKISTRTVDFKSHQFISQLERDLSVLMELQDSNSNSVSPEDIKKPLSVVRKRLLTMLDRALYHQLDHTQKVTIAKANLIAGICTAAIHTGYCKDALALYRQSLTLFRELNTDATNNGYVMEDSSANKQEIDPFILSLIQDSNNNDNDPGKYSMFIVVIYYQMSLLYDKSLIEKVQKSRYYLIQALNLLVRENAMNSNKYCIETLQRLALFALETGKDEEYINMMLITLNIMKKCNESIGKILDVEIHFAKNLLSYGHQLPNNNNPNQRQRFETVKAEYQKLLTQIITDAKQENTVVNTETRRTLSKLLELAKFLLGYNQLSESYKVYHCMRKMCDDTQINLDLDFMKVWLSFVREFIGCIVKQNAQSQQMMNKKVLWSEQILELCEFDVKVLEKVQQTTDIDIGTDIYKEYILCSNALIAVNVTCDEQIVQRCRSYLSKAINSPKQEVQMNAQRVLDTLAKIENN